MNAQTQRFFIPGAAGAIECALDLPEGAPRGIALVAHPHPLYGGTMDNKVLIAALLLTACTLVPKSEPSILYDLGPLHTERAGQGLPALPPISIAEIQVPAALDSTMMFFRLNYANSLQPRPYAQARWSMTPAQLLAQRLKARIVQSGGVVLSAFDGSASAPVLRIEADEFTQNFDAPGNSSGQVGLRASVFKGRTLVAQKTFVRQAPAPSADASGGAAALAAASDAAIADMIVWLGTLPLR